MFVMLMQGNLLTVKLVILSGTKSQSMDKKTT
ncbi:hypothetical protein GLYMA_15G246450v4 [Glycine max]|nr:hypothetical protein GLYMA_15G246450v4 [Glycine max]